MDEKPERLTDHKEPVLALISPAQRDLLKWLRDKMPFGAAMITTQYGEPEGTREALASVKFGRQE